MVQSMTSRSAQTTVSIFELLLLFCIGASWSGLGHGTALPSSSTPWFSVLDMLHLHSSAAYSARSTLGFREESLRFSEPPGARPSSTSSSPSRRSSSSSSSTSSSTWSSVPVSLRNSTWISLNDSVTTLSSSCCAVNMVPRPGLPYDSCQCVYPIRLELFIYDISPTFMNWSGVFQQELASQLGFDAIQIEITSFQFDGLNLSLAIVIGPLDGVSFSMQQAETVKANLEMGKVRFDSSLFGNYSLLRFQYNGPLLPLAVQPPSIMIPNLPLHQILPQDDSKHRVNRQHMWHIFMIAAIAATVAVVSVPILLWRCFKNHNIDSRTEVLAEAGLPKEPVSSHLDVRSYATRVFSFEELRDGTNNFEAKTVLGEGGFGRVYKGVLKDGTLVAIKRLNGGGQGGNEFAVEVEMLSRLHHRNLVKLIGYFISPDLSRQHLLCYELVPNGNLESWLHGPLSLHKPLDWDTRMKIALDAARGLAYLHEDSQPPVIHRDFKASNILIDDDFHAKISDFGLAKQAPDGQQNYVATQVMGTFGYVAPEYAMTGHLLVKSDVYSYGVVLLELLSGRKPVDMSQPFGQENLVTWAHPILGDNERLGELADPRLSNAYPVDDFARVAAIAAACVAPEVSQRPTMGEVVISLKTVQRIPEYSTTGGRTSSARRSVITDRCFTSSVQTAEVSTPAFESNASFSVNSSRTFPHIFLDNGVFSRSIASSEDLEKGR